MHSKTLSQTEAFLSLRGLSPLEPEDSKNIQTQIDSILLRVSDLHEQSSPTTIYLEEYENADTRTQTLMRRKIPGLPFENPSPNHTESLVHLSIHSHDETILLRNHLLLPLTLMPVLNNIYVRGKTWSLQNIFQSSKETVAWVVIPMTFYRQCRTPEDFMQEVEFALQMESMDGRSAIVDRPGMVSRNAFWLQVRGVFHGPGDVYAAAKQQACLFRRLVMGRYIALGPEALGYDQAFETVCVPPHERVCSRFDMGSIRCSSGNTTEAGRPQA